MAKTSTCPLRLNELSYLRLNTAWLAATVLATGLCRNFTIMRWPARTHYSNQSQMQDMFYIASVSNLNSPGAFCRPEENIK